MNGENRIVSKPQDELASKRNPEVDNEGAFFTVDAMNVDVGADRSALDAVYRKTFNTIDELKGVLEANNLQMADMPMRLQGSGSNYAQVEVFKGGVRVATLGIKANVSLVGTPISNELNSGEHPQLPQASTNEQIYSSSTVVEVSI